MGDRKRSFGEALEYRVAVRRFASAFEACEHLPLSDRQLLLKDIANRIFQQLSAAPPEEQKAVKVTGITIKQSP